MNHLQQNYQFVIKQENVEDGFTGL